MPDTNLNNPAPQFETAQYAAKPGIDVCKSCNQPVAGPYFRVNGAMACASCAEKTRQSIPKDSHSAFIRGLLFGFGSAVLGLILYSAFAIMTGLVIGYISLAVGFIIGKAIIMGSKGIGGRRYQITAALLTYAAVSMSAIPISISIYMKDHKGSSTTPVQRSTTQPNSSATPPPAAVVDDGPSDPKPSLGAALLSLAFVGLASPFLELSDPVHGVIGLVILFVGIRIAWQLTAMKVPQIIGPFSNVAAPVGQAEPR